MIAACCCLFSFSKLFLDISTGSYMNHSAFLPGTVRHFACSYRRNDRKLPMLVSVASATPVWNAL
jgi:hypothetical protein